MTDGKSILYRAGYSRYPNPVQTTRNSVSNRQRLWEKKERESRENNMLGIEEKLDCEERKNTLDLVNEFLESKMKTTSIKAAQARRLGRRTQAPS